MQRMDMRNIVDCLLYAIIDVIIFLDIRLATLTNGLISTQRTRFQRFFHRMVLTNGQHNQVARLVL